MRFVPILMLLCVALAVTPALAVETAESVLQQQARHGYPSPQIALQRLRAAEPLPDNTPPLLRQRYFATLASLAVEAGDKAVADEAFSRLTAMSQEEDCKACATVVASQDVLKHAYSIGGRHDRPYATLMDAIKLADAVPGLERVGLVATIDLAGYYARQQDYPRAIEYSLRAEAAAIRLGDESTRAAIVGGRGLSMARMGRVEAGLALLEKGIVIAEKAGAPGVALKLLDDLIALHESLDQPQPALDAMRRWMTLDKEIVSRQREMAVRELQEKSLAERKDREIERLSLEGARKQAEAEGRIWQQRLWVAMALALLLSALLLMGWLRRVRRRNRRLEIDHASLSKESVHDPLTGAYNRRHCERLMSHQDLTLHGSSRDREYKACVALVLLDIDLFKAVNDTHGHAAGDAVLVEFAERLQKQVRQRDAVVRWGGEEFVLVLPGTPAEGLPTVIERILAAIGGEPMDIGGKSLVVTVSAGSAVWPLFPGQHWEDALHIADLALYRSKITGRNRATCLMEISPGADMDRVRRDLAAAHESGDVTLLTIPGP